MSKKKVDVSDKTIEWLEKIHKAGATKNVKGKTKVNDVVRAHVTAIHAALAGGTDNDTFKELETSFDAAIVDTGVIDDGTVVVAWP